MVRKTPFALKLEMNIFIFIMRKNPMHMPSLNNKKELSGFGGEMSWVQMVYEVDLETGEETGRMVECRAYKTWHFMSDLPE